MALRKLESEPYRIPRTLIWITPAPARMDVTPEDQFRQARDLALHHRSIVAAVYTLPREGVTAEQVRTWLMEHRPAWVITVDREGITADPGEYLAILTLLRRRKVCLHLLDGDETIAPLPMSGLVEFARIGSRWTAPEARGTDHPNHETV